MPFLTMRSVVLAALENTEKQSGLPSAASNAIVTIGQPQFAIEAEDLDRDIPSNTLSKWGTVPGLRNATLNFTTEFKGPARAVSSQATALREDPLFRACGMVPTFSASSCIYTFDTSKAAASQSATATLYAHLDGIRHIMRACRGSFNITAEDGQYAKIDWQFKGLFDPITASTSVGEIADIAMPSATYDAVNVIPPAVMGATFQLHGSSSLCIQALNLTINNNIQMRPCISAPGGYDGMLIGSREVTGTINPEAVPRSLFDFFFKWQTAATGALVFQHADPTQAWTTIGLTAPAVQFKIPKWADRNDYRIFDIDISFNRSAGGTGDDELVILFKQ